VKNNYIQAKSNLQADKSFNFSIGKRKEANSPTIKVK
jgi:hypothetical protein